MLMPVLFVMLLVAVGYAVVEGDLRAASLSFRGRLPAYSSCAPGRQRRIAGSPVSRCWWPWDMRSSRSAWDGRDHNPMVPTCGPCLDHRGDDTIALADTAVALLAGLAIFPIVFASGLEPAAGPGLIFQTLPIAFGNMPGAMVRHDVFVLLVFAARSSSISIAEPAVAWLVDTRNWRRPGSLAGRRTGMAPGERLGVVFQCLVRRGIPDLRKDFSSSRTSSPPM